MLINLTTFAYINMLSLDTIEKVFIKFGNLEKGSFSVEYAEFPNGKKVSCLDYPNALNLVTLKVLVEHVSSIIKDIPLSELVREPQLNCYPENSVEQKLIRDSEFSSRVKNSLIDNGVICIGDLSKKSEYELLRLPNLGRLSINQIRDFMQKINLPIIRLYPGELASYRGSFLSCKIEDPNSIEIAKAWLEKYKEILSCNDEKILRARVFIHRIGKNI